jgi:shikimate dehydrogenase
MPNPADTLTLDDLKKWDRGDKVSLAVLGHPVAHSVSPQMHNAALAELAQNHPRLKDWCYFKFEIKPEELKTALDLLRRKNFKGVNLTLPHKIAGARYIDNAQVSMTGEGAVNTLTPTPNGWDGETTDEFGFDQALRQNLKITLAGTPVVILGAGGAAFSIALLCLRFSCKELSIGNRDPVKREQFVRRLGQMAQFYGSKAKLNQSFDINQPPLEKWPDNILVINATSLGLKSSDPMPLDVAKLPAQAIVFDTVYNRSGTSFVKAALQRGLRATDGVSMLVWQGAKSLTMWIKAAEGIEVKPEAIAPTMMTAACQALGLPPRHV